MKRTLKIINEELKSLDLCLEVVPKWYRNRELKGTKQFYVKGGGTVCWEGSDGESHYSPRVCVKIAVKSVSEITLDLIRSEYVKQHENGTLETALKKAKIEQKKAEEDYAIRRAEFEAEQKTKSERLSTKASSETVTHRKTLVSNRFAEGFSSKDKALIFFAHTHQGTILADHYREEFTTLIQNPSVLGMAMDLCTLQYLDLDEMSLSINKRAHQLNIPFHSIGGVSGALKYLCQDFIEK